jgi:ornithine decarboxylase
MANLTYTPAACSGSARHDDSFYVVYPDRIASQAKRFTDLFCGRVIYAVKANSNRTVLTALLKGGVTGFDVASQTEVANVSDWFGDVDCYFMNPVKCRSGIVHAYSASKIKAFSVDHISEVKKLHELLPHDDEDILIFVRLACEGGGAVFNLSEKFGGSDAEVLEQYAFLTQNTSWKVGLTFHVGSQTLDPRQFHLGIDKTEKLMGEANLKIHALDIGGGFPGEYANSRIDSLEEYVESINVKIRNSANLKNVEIMCEPGRALVYNGMSLFSRVNLRKGKSLYLTSGVYNGLYAAQRWLMFPIRCWRDGELIVDQTNCKLEVYGPTCDGLDKLGFEFSFPGSIRENDWIEFQNVGAYSLALQTGFNGFETHKVISAGEGQTSFPSFNDGL